VQAQETVRAPVWAQARELQVRAPGLQVRAQERPAQD